LLFWPQKKAPVLPCFRITEALGIAPLSLFTRPGGAGFYDDEFAKNILRVSIPHNGQKTARLGSFSQGNKKPAEAGFS
jgi:hypothetical protein